MSAKSGKTPKPDKPNGTEKVTIHIDRDMYKVEAHTLTAEELCGLPDPDIGADRDLYREVPGQAEDDLVQAGETVSLKDGMHFFTAPAAITPGHVARA